MHPMSVAALEQQLLAGNWLHIEDQREKPGDPRMEANLARRRQIDVKIEQALEPVFGVAPDSFNRESLLR